MHHQPAGGVSRRLAPLGVALVALAATLAGLGNGLIQDDAALLVESDQLHGLAHWAEILTRAYWPPPHAPDLWRPLTSLLLAMEHGLGGGSALVFRMVSIVLYVALAVLVWRLAARLLPWGVAVMVGLLFAAHPVHVEAVALAVGQAELLVAVFGVLMVARYLDRRQTGAALRPGDWLWLGILYLAACLSKEHGVILPLLLVLVELFLVAEPRTWRRLLPGYALLAGTGLVFLFVRAQVLGSWVGSFAAAPLVGASLGNRARIMLQVVPRWVRLLAWPKHLQADYSPAEIQNGAVPGLLIAGAVLLTLGVIGAWVTRRRAPVVGFGLGWTGLALLPVSNLIVPTGIVLAERTLLLSSIGFVLLIGGLVALLRTRIAPPLATHSWSRWILPVGGTILVLAMTVRSATRIRIWRDRDRFVRESARDAPSSWRTQLSFGSLLLQAGQGDSAATYYQRALEFAPDPERWKVRSDLAVELFARDEIGEAVKQLRLSLVDAPDQIVTRHYLVLGLLMLGDYAGAAAQADSALARGGAREEFQELRVLADSAAKLGLPAGAIRIRVRNPGS